MNVISRMKRRIQIAVSLPMLILLAVFSAFCLFLQPSRPVLNSAKKGADHELSQEKFTILPFVLLGGIRFFKKAVEKKQLL